MAKLIDDKYFDEEEKELIESIERGEWKSIKDLEKEKKRYAKIFKEFNKKRIPITIRIKEKDLLDIKVRAVKEGIPYQTLIGSIIHKYISGQLAEKKV